MLKLLRRPLPDKVEIIVRTALLMAVAVPIHQLWELPHSLPEQTSKHACVVTLVACIASLILALYSHHVPPAIRNSTSVLALALWIAIAASFATAALFYLRSVLWACFVAMAVLALLLLSLFLYIDSIRQALSTAIPQNEDIDAEGARLIVAICLTLLASVGAVTVVALPTASFFSASLQTVQLSGSLMHVTAFLIWGAAATVISFMNNE